MKRLKYFITSILALVSIATLGAYAANNLAGKLQNSPKLLKVHFIDVGQADSILVQTPGGKSMLIDAGNNDDGDLVTGYLKDLGIERIDVIVGTHPHEDHIGGMDTVIKNFETGRIYMPKASANTKTFEDVLTAVKNSGLTITRAAPGLSISLEDGIAADILAPNSTGYEDDNNYSVVLRLVYGETSFLFTGDAEKISEKEMLDKGYELRSDLLKVGHHGSISSSSQEFLKSVSPRYAVISVGRDNPYGHPAQATLNRLSAAGIEIFRTDESGTIVAISDGKQIIIDSKASPVNPQAPPYTTDESNTVYITSTGELYHRQDCAFLKDSRIPISLTDAKSKGYLPCSKCKPPK